MLGGAPYNEEEEHHEERKEEKKEKEEREVKREEEHHVSGDRDYSDLLGGHVEEESQGDPKEKARQLAEEHGRLVQEFDENEEKIKQHAEVSQFEKANREQADQFEEADELETRNQVIRAEINEKEQEIRDLGFASVEEALA